MVFEYIFGARDVEGRPMLMFAAGFVYTVISVPLALLLHSSAASILAVSLATIAGVPLILKIVEFESDMLDLYPKSVFTREARVVALYLWFFFGEIAGFTTAYLMLSPSEFAAATDFQMKDLGFVESVRSSITGNAVSPRVFNIIFWNNMRVYTIGVLLSFIYGTGGVFILTWNASVIATLLASKIQESGSILSGIIHFLGILPHGIIEYGAYVIAGFTGALISLAILQKGWNGHLIRDALIFLITGILLLYLGAAIESSFLPGS